jgi:hypothetical protein
MKKQIQFIVLMGIMLSFALPQFAQESARDKGFKVITKEVLQGQLEFLASDWTEGREAGTKGEYIASDYIASLFKMFGLQPGGDLESTNMGRGARPTAGTTGARPEPKRTYFQNFNVVETSPGEVQEMSILTKSANGSKSVNFDYQTDFSLTPGQAGIEAEVPIVFVGYGLIDEKNGYDDFKGLDVKGKIVIKLSGFPGSKDPGSKAFEKFKPAVPVMDPNQRRQVRPGGFGGNAWAAEKGVIGVIEYRPGSDPTTQWASNLPYRYNTATYEGDVPQSSRVRKSMALMGDKVENRPMTFQVTDRVINEIISGSGIDFEAIEKQIAETGKPASRELTGKFIRIKTTVDSRIVRVRNVVGVLEGKNTEEIIVVGGHYDHLGKQDGFVFNGADDNASGTVGVMTIAKAMIATGVKPEKTIVFCAWTAEEKGLIGSKYFADHPYKDKILCNLNYDMISRNSPGEDQDNKISMTYSNKFPVSKELVEKFNKDLNMGLEIRYSGSDRPSGGSDHAPFAAKDIPIYYFMAGMPPEYHKYNDHIELVNWDKMLKIVQLGYLSIFELAQMPWN